MSTLEFPSGQTILVVENDVTHNMCFFGTREDALFPFVTDISSQKKFHLIYLDTNFGARIGVAV